MKSKPCMACFEIPMDLHWKTPRMIMLSDENKAAHSICKLAMAGHPNTKCSFTNCPSIAAHAKPAMPRHKLRTKILTDVDAVVFLAACMRGSQLIDSNSAQSSMIIASIICPHCFYMLNYCHNQLMRCRPSAANTIMKHDTTHLQAQAGCSPTQANIMVHRAVGTKGALQKQTQ